MENGSFIDGLPIKNGDFHSYVSLPEGTIYKNLQSPKANSASGSAWAACSELQWLQRHSWRDA